MADIKTVEVANCQDCPCCNNDNEFGHAGCNIDTDIYAKGIYDELPSDKGHEKCPLKKMEINIKLKQA